MLVDREFDSYCNVINVNLTVTPGQAYTLDSINESIIWQMNPVVVAAFLHA